eukprot:5225533-Pyramimonas_sp.AAC.1
MKAILHAYEMAITYNQVCNGHKTIFVRHALLRIEQCGRVAISEQTHARNAALTFRDRAAQSP